MTTLQNNDLGARFDAAGVRLSLEFERRRAAAVPDQSRSPRGEVSRVVAVSRAERGLSKNAGGTEN